MTPSSVGSSATVREVVELLRSAWITRGAAIDWSIASAMSASVSSASWAGATGMLPVPVATVWSMRGSGSGGWPGWPRWLALTGLRPIVDPFVGFLVERPFGQVELDLGHQGVGAVLVSANASCDRPACGRTHVARGGVVLLDTLPGWTVLVPRHPDEAGPLMRDAVAGGGLVCLRLSAEL